MKFYNINNKDIQVSFKDAILQGFNLEKQSLFMPMKVEKISPSIIYRDPPPSFRDLAFYIIKQFCGDEIPEQDLMSIVAQFFPHRIPVSPIAPTTYLMELFHGDTCNYKDIGSGFLAQLLNYFNKNERTPFSLIVAASGEQTCSIATAFSKVHDIKTFILYPKNSLTEIQERIINSSRNNIFLFAIDGTLDDCSKIMHSAISNNEIKEKLNLVPGGVFNFAPILPQIAFFVYASLSVLYRCGYDNRIENPSIIVSMPSGSFSSLLAGLFAKKMGTPIKGFISAENENRVISNWLTEKQCQEFKFDDLCKVADSFQNKPAKTNTPALDFANPINFVRMLEIYSFDDLKKLIIPYWLNNEDTIQAVRACADRTGCIIDPYSAMAWQAWHTIYKEAQCWYTETEKNSLIGLILQTSHPAKFLDIMKPAIGRPPSLPNKLESLPYNTKKTINLSSNSNEFQEWLLDSYC